MKEKKAHWLVKRGIKKARFKRATELEALANDTKQKKTKTE